MSRFAGWALLLAAWKLWSPFVTMLAQAASGIPGVGSVTPPTVPDPPWPLVELLLGIMLLADIYLAWCESLKL